MNIKKVDDKPMAIHTKEKTKLHVKATPETKLKGRNVLTADRSPKIVGAVKETDTDKNDRRKPAMKVRTKGEAGKTADKDKKTFISGENMRGNSRTASEKRGRKSPAPFGALQIRKQWIILIRKRGSLFLAIAVSLLLLPKQLAKGKLEGNKKYIVGVVSLVIAVAVMGIVYLSNGGFPAVNLIFA